MYSKTRDIYSVVITRKSNPPISQFNSLCNEFTNVWSMFVYNRWVTLLRFYIYYLFCNSLVHVIYSRVSGQCSHAIISHNKCHASWLITKKVERIGPGPNFIIKDLPSVLIQIIADQILNDLLCCSYKYNCCLCRCIGKLFYTAWNIPDKFVWNILD